MLASFGEIMAYVGYVALAILVLLIMITVHEFGHYIAGKIFKFGINEFAIGFGPKIFSKQKKNGEIVSVRLLPIGGFCAFNGEDEESDDPTAFNNKKWWQRIIVLVSGAFMNYLLALIFIMLMFGIYGVSALIPVDLMPTDQVAQEYCFQSKDVIITANGKNVYLIPDLMDAVGGREKGDLVDFVVRRAGVDTPIKVQLREDTHFNNVEDIPRLFEALGFTYMLDENGQIRNSGLYSTSVPLGFFQVIGRSFEYSFMLAGTIFTVLGQLITGTLGIASMGGTVTTISVAADAIMIGGFRNLLNIASFIGVNLAVFNLLPFPALDGSRVVFTAIEGIRRKPLNRRVEGIIHMVGLILLLCFAVFVDVQRCF